MAIYPLKKASAWDVRLVPPINLIVISRTQETRPEVNCGSIKYPVPDVVTAKRTSRDAAGCIRNSHTARVNRIGHDYS